MKRTLIITLLLLVAAFSFSQTNATFNNLDVRNTTKLRGLIYPFGAVATSPINTAVHEVAMINNTTFALCRMDFEEFADSIANYLNPIIGTHWYTVPPDTIKTIYNVVVDSSFLMKYNNYKLGYGDAYGNNGTFIGYKNIDSTNLFYQNGGNNLTSQWLVNKGDDRQSHILLEYSNVLNYAYIDATSREIDTSSQIGVYPDSILLYSDNNINTSWVVLNSDSLYIKTPKTIINGDLTVTGYLKSGTGSIADNDSTPSVASYNTFIYAGSANPVSIDALDDHVVGCYYTIIGNSNTYTITVIDGTPAGGDSFNLAGGNWVGGSQDVLVLYCIAADAFIEVSRSDN